MERGDCVSPLLETPFMGVSLDRVCDRKVIAGKLTWYHQAGYDYRYSEDVAHPCSLDSQIGEIVGHAMAKVNGLKLQDLLENIRTPSRT